MDRREALKTMTTAAAFAVPAMTLDEIAAAVQPLREERERIEAELARLRGKSITVPNDVPVTLDEQVRALGGVVVDLGAPDSAGAGYRRLTVR